MHTETLIAPSRAVRRSRTNSWLAIAWLTGLAICAQAHADEKLELLGGPGGGAFEAHCPAGQLLVGLELRAADDVDAIRPLCATANGPRDAGDGTAEQTWYGGDGGRPVSLVCPKYTPIVTGMYVRTDGKDTLIVNNIHLFCGVAAAVPESNHAPGASFDAPDYDGAGTILHFPGYEVDCSSGQVGVGVYGKSGIWLDSVSLICGAPTVASAPMPGNVVTSIGRMPTSSPSGPLMSLCQRAKDARARNSPAASNLEAQCNASKKASNVVDKVVIEPPSAPAPAYLYSIDHDGKLRWYHQDGVKNDPSDWQGPRVVDKHWDDFKQVFAGGDGIIYAITKKGSLMRYRHAGFATGSGKNDPGSWQAPQQLASGWGDYTQAFSVGHGVIYAIARDGTLQWFRHTGFSGGKATMDGPRNVGHGWNGLKAFAGGDGVMYTIAPDGKLRWYKHNAFMTGGGLDTPGAWENRTEVGSGWNGFDRVFAAGNGVIYAVAHDGTLLRYRHRGYQTGKFAWDAAQPVATGWGNLRGAFAQP